VLPPGLGFAGFWLLFQSLLAAARIGGFGLQLLIAVVAALIALSVGLAAFASVRLFGVAFLGRPRTPRTAVAEEVAFPARGVLIGLASLTGLLGLVPALALLPAARALAALANGGSGASGFAMSLQPGAEAPGYAPIVVAALLLIIGCALLWLLHRGAAQSQRHEAAWSGGFAPPPAWLPFGDPASQYGPVSFADPLRRAERSLLAKPEAAARSIITKLARQRDRLLHALTAPGDADAPRSVAAMLVVVVLATFVWLVVP
jgi:hydrogenase-4 component B